MTEPGLTDMMLTEPGPSAISKDHTADPGLTPGRDPRADERQPVPLRRVRDHRPGHYHGGEMKAFSYAGATEPGTRSASTGSAVFRATGRRIRDLPVTPAKLL